MIIPNDIFMPEVEKILREGKRVVLKAKGNSMLPFIRNLKDSVELEPVCVEKLSRGDIVLARVNGTNVYVLHRILSIKGEMVVLMGDGNIRGKEFCRTADICGKVMRILAGEKETDPNSATERRKAILWMKLLPVRRWLLALYRVGRKFGITV